MGWATDRAKEAARKAAAKAAHAANGGCPGSKSGKHNMGRVQLGKDTAIACRNCGRL